MPAPAKAAIWFVVCNVVNKGISLLATPILTRIMSAEQYGTFSVFQSWVSIMTIFCTLNLFGNAYSRGRLNFKGDVARFESSLLALSSLLTLVLFGVFCVAPEFWAAAMGLTPFLVVLLFAEIALVSATSFWSARQRFEYRYRALAAVTIAMNVFSLVAGIVAILCTDAKVEARVVMDVLAKGVPGLILGIMIFSKGRCFFDKRYWKYGLAFTLPLVPHFLSHFVLNQSDRLMISQMVGNDAAAFYSVSYSIAMAMVIVTNAINDSYVPYTFQELSKKRIDGVRRNGHLVLALVGVLCLMLMAFGPEILAVFAGPEYSEAVGIIPPLSASVFFIFLYSMLSNIEYFYEKTLMISTASIIAAALNIVLNLITIPLFGYHAAAWTTLASYMALAVMHWVFYHRISKRELGRDVYQTRYLVMVSFVMLSFSFGMIAFYAKPLVRYSFLFVVAIVLVVKRKQIMGILRMKG